MKKKLILGLLIICFCIIIGQDVKGGTVGTSTQLQPALLQGPPAGWDAYTQPVSMATFPEVTFPETLDVNITSPSPLPVSFTVAQPGFLQAPSDPWVTNYSQPVTISGPSPLHVSFTVAQPGYTNSDPTSSWTLVRSYTGDRSSDTAAMAPVDFNRFTEGLCFVEIVQGAIAATTVSADISPVYLRTNNTSAYSPLTAPTAAAITITGSTPFKITGGSWFWVALPRTQFSTTASTAAVMNIWVKGIK